MDKLTITSLAFGGDGVGRIDGKTVFVPLSAPGDELTVRITERHKSFDRAEIVQVLAEGSSRAAPPCQLFGQCGGCQLQHVRYDQQASSKHDQFARAIEGRGAGLSATILHPIAAAVSPLGYRRRARLRWSRTAGRRGALVLGFRKRASHAVQDITVCPVLSEAIGSAVTRCRMALENAPLGTDGEISLLCGADGSVHGCVQSHGSVPSAELSRHADVLLSSGLAGALVMDDCRRHVVRGAASVDLRARPMGQLHGSAETFAQANPAQEQVLSELVLRSLAVGDEPSMLEFHAGIGTFTSLLAPTVRRLVAVESNPASVALLRQNLAQSTTTVELTESTAEAYLAGLSPRGQTVDAVLLDPPRQGCRAVVEVLGLVQRPKRIVYVSCDPMTLARDLGSLVQYGYQVKTAGALDMMPHTGHIEGVVCLDR